MNAGYELCPHCVIVPLTPRSNGSGYVYLECMDCGYYAPVERVLDPYPTMLARVRCADGRTRSRYKGDTRTKRKPLRIPTDVALQALRDLAERLGRTPHWREMGQGRCPSHHWFRFRFGTMKAALDAAGLAHRGPGGNRTHHPTPTGRNGREQAA